MDTLVEIQKSPSTGGSVEIKWLEKL